MFFSINPISVNYNLLFLPHDQRPRKLRDRQPDQDSHLQVIATPKHDANLLLHIGRQLEYGRVALQQVADLIGRQEMPEVRAQIAIQYAGHDGETDGPAHVTELADGT